MIPYTTVKSGTCESNGMKTIRKIEDCITIFKAFKKIGFARKYDDFRNRGDRYETFEVPYEDYLNTWHSLVLPFGCLFNDNGFDSLVWNPTLEFQESIPCGSIWNEHKYYCFCEK